MKKIIRILVLIAPVLLLKTHAHEGCTCGRAVETKTVAAAVTAEAPQRHALRGVVVRAMPDQSALLVKHEEIPGVMKAMTMLLKVDEKTLSSPAAKKDTAIIGYLVRKSDGWWLEEAKVAPAASH